MHGCRTGTILSLVQASTPAWRQGAAGASHHSSHADACNLPVQQAARCGSLGFAGRLQAVPPSWHVNHLHFSGTPRCAQRCACLGLRIWMFHCALALGVSSLCFEHCGEKGCFAMFWLRQWWPDLARRGRAANPIAHVLQAIDEPLDLLTYNQWNVLLPEGDFMTKVGGSQFEDVLQQVSPSAIPEWRVRPLIPPPFSCLNSDSCCQPARDSVKTCQTAPCWHHARIIT